jgi:hypothetical protein
MKVYLIETFDTSWVSRHHNSFSGVEKSVDLDASFIQRRDR